MAESILYTFLDNGSDGFNPQTNVIINNGIIYGGTNNGGASNRGTIWSVPVGGGSTTNLYEFTGGVNGAGVNESIVLVGDTLYGTCGYEGAIDQGIFWSCPISGGPITQLYVFSSGVGYDPRSGVSYFNGLFYGTTYFGGTNFGGILYSMTSGGTITVIANFDRPSIGTLASSAPVTDGVNLYGPCSIGGTNDLGTIWSAPIGGGGISAIYNFNGTDGSAPSASLIIDGNTLYGTASAGGTGGSGVVFSILTDGSDYTVLHNFTGSDGNAPQTRLVLNGNTLYGTTDTGGTDDVGVIYSISTSGDNFRVLYNFRGGSDASTSNALTLINNILYGSSYDGGLPDDTGTVFQLDLNDAPCFNEGTGILCLNDNLKDVYIPIEDIRKDTLVKTYKHGYRKVTHIGKNHMINDNSKLHGSMRIMQKDENMTDDLIVTGGHSILVDKLSLNEIAIHKKYNQPIKKIDDKFLLLAAASDKFKMMRNKDLYTFYHLVLDNEGSLNKKYGIWSNGVLTESADLNDFKKHNLSLL